MICGDILALMDRMLDEELLPDTRASFLLHLKSCISCRLMWQDNLSVHERMHQFRDEIFLSELLVHRIRKSLTPTPVTPGAAEEFGGSVTQQLLREDFLEVMAGLSVRERDVLRLRFGLDDGRQRTLEEVAQLFGVTRERIRQIEAKALRKLRHPNRNRHLSDYVD